ncbi:MAG: sulfite exporter TauE/SafE family protein [Chloroflexota bacterium]
MPENTVVFFIAFALACFLTGVSKGGLGGMLGALITPMLSLVMPPNLVVGLMLPVLMLADMFAVAAHWRRWEARLIWMLLLGAVVGVTLATRLITGLTVETLRRILGVLALLFVVYRLSEARIRSSLRYAPRNWHGALAGSIAGFVSTLAHAGGPPVSIYLLMQGLSPRAFVATAALFIAVLNWIKVPYYYYAGLFNFEQQVRLIWLAPLVPLGVWVGKRLVQQVNRVWFERVMIVLLSITGVLLLVR